MASVENVSALGFWQLFIIGILTILILKVIQQVIKFRKYRKFFSEIPGRTDLHWIYGDLHTFPGPNERGVRFLAEEVCTFPRLKRIWTSSLICRVHFHHPDHLRKLLKSSEPKPRSIGTVYTGGIDWLGEGLLISNGKKWSRTRKLLTPAFHFDILQPYINVKNEAADVLLGKIDKCVEFGKSFELFEYMSLCTLDLLLRCVFSYTGDIQALGEKHPYIKAVNELGDGWIKRMLNPFYFPDFIFYMTSEGRKFSRNCKFVHTFANEIINKRKQELERKEQDHRKYLDFLDILLKARDEDGVGLSDGEIRNEADTFLFEGHDTTTSALSWTLYSLATHPECQSKIQAEVDKIYAGKDSDYLTTNDLHKMEYMTMCLKESLRLHSPVFYIQRTLTKEFECDGHVIPTGTTVGAHIYCVHHNPTVWKDPMEFRPERFSPENVQNRDTFAFVPFSAGPRNCIGQNFAMHEMKILLARLLHKYTITLDTSVPVLRRLGAVMKAENGIHVFAKPRNVTL